jgi:tryptophan synthase alpha chain
VQLVTERSRGFVYLVSVTGITGARDALPADLAAFVRRVRVVTDKPLAVGFGISKPEQAARVARLANGVIVGSAIVRLAGEPDGVQKVGTFVAGLRRAVAAR